MNTTESKYYHPTPRPFFDEMIDLACELAREQGAKRQHLDLIRWPDWCEPCPTATKEQLQWAKDMRAKAAKILHERTAAPKRKIVTRKRSFTVIKPLPTRRTLAPPGGYKTEKPSVVSPCRPEREVLLLRDTGISGRLIPGDSQTLFDNRIVITAA